MSGSDESGSSASVNSELGFWHELVEQDGDFILDLYGREFWVTVDNRTQAQIQVGFTGIGQGSARARNIEITSRPDSFDRDFKGRLQILDQRVFMDFAERVVYQAMYGAANPTEVLYHLSPITEEDGYESMLCTLTASEVMEEITVELRRQRAVRRASQLDQPIVGPARSSTAVAPVQPSQSVRTIIGPTQSVRSVQRSAAVQPVRSVALVQPSAAVQLVRSNRFIRSVKPVPVLKTEPIESRMYHDFDADSVYEGMLLDWLAELVDKYGHVKCINTTCVTAEVCAMLALDVLERPQKNKNRAWLLQFYRPTQAWREY